MRTKPSSIRQVLLSATLSSAVIQAIFMPAPAMVPAPSAVPAGKTMFWPVEKTRVTSAFGHRTHPVTGRVDFHAGVDLSARLNQPVRTVIDGTVVKAGLRGALGKAVEVKHPSRGVTTIYGHMNALSVRAGQKVKRGQKIGLAGSTGRSTGPHLHFTVKRSSTGASIDPIAFLRNLHLKPPIAPVRFDDRRQLAVAPVKSKKPTGVVIAKPSKAEIAMKQSELDAARQQLREKQEDASKFVYLFNEGAVSKKAAEEKQQLATDMQEKVNNLQAAFDKLQG